MLSEAVTVPHTQPQERLVRWNLFTRIAFRFAFCYLSLWCLRFWEEIYVVCRFIYLDLVAKSMPTGVVDPFTAPLWHNVVPWVGKHILHLATPITVFSNGSDDTTYDYVLAFCFLSISAIVTVVWSMLDSRRPNYQVMHQWLRFAVGLALAAEMLGYGTDKVIPLQFGSLTFSRLSEPLGQMSPAMLLWNFMAASKPYTIAVGLLEVVGGVLLLIPRFTTLGALISLASMVNVFALNMCYDVPIKLIAFHMGLSAAFLLVPELPRLLNVFVLNRPAAPVVHVPLSSRTRIRRGALLFQIAVGLFLFLSMMYSSLHEYSRLQTQRAAPVFLYGVWNVDEFTVSDNSGTSLFTPKLLQHIKIPAWKDRWERLVFQAPDLAFIQLSNGALDRVKPKVDPQNNSLSFVDPDDATWQCSLTMQTPDTHSLRLQGTVNGLTVSAKLHREDEDRFILVTRGFHWIQEYPYYR
jgi:uncharacterized membrane protein YphA (DoxX/SURF4 family)